MFVCSAHHGHKNKNSVPPSCAHTTSSNHHITHAGLRHFTSHEHFLLGLLGHRCWLSFIEVSSAGCFVFLGVGCVFGDILINKTSPSFRLGPLPPAPQPPPLGFKVLFCGGMVSMFLCWTSTSSSPISDVCVWWYRFKVVIWLHEHVSVLDLHLQLLNLCCLCIRGDAKYMVVFWLDDHVSVLDLHLQLLNLCCLCLCVDVRYKVVFWLDDHVSVLDLHPAPQSQLPVSLCWC